MGRRVGKDSAYEHFDSALAIRKTLAFDFPLVPEYRRELAANYNNLGNLLSDLNTLAGREGAEAAYREALSVLEKLVNESPEIAQPCQQLAAAYNNLGTLLERASRFAEAQNAYCKAVMLLKKLTSSSSNVPAYTVELAATYGNMGNLLRSLHKPEEALSWYGQAIDSLYNSDLGLGNAKAYLQNSYQGKADALLQLGGLVEAEKHLKLALDLADDELAKTRINIGWAVCLARAGRIQQAVQMAEEALAPKEAQEAEVLYDGACVFSWCSQAAGPAELKEKYAARAMHLLDRALAKGRNNVGDLKGDPDLDPLRAREDFKKMLRELGPG